jgi:hypothetical protein
MPDLILTLEDKKMKNSNKLIFLFMAIGILPLTVYPDNLQLKNIIFPKSKKLISKKVLFTDYRIDNFSDKIVVSGTRPNTNLAEFILFDIEGNELMKKEGFKYIPKIAVSEKTDKIIAINNYNIRNEQINECFDLKGKKLWEKWIPAPGITQSLNGTYGIIPRVSGDEGLGKFMVFDLSSGSELPVPFSNDYSFFFAKFVDDSRVALLLQKIESRRDMNMARQISDQYNKLIKEGKKREATALMKNSNGGWLEPYRKLTFVIYDISTESVIVEKDLNLMNSTNFYLKWDENNNFTNSSDAEFFAIAGYNSKNKENKFYSPTTIQILNDHGELLWERDNFKSIKDIRIFNKILIVLDEECIHIIQIENENDIINFKSEGIQRGSKILQTHILGDEDMLIEIGDNISTSATEIININLIKKNIYPIDDVLKKMMLITRIGNKGIIFDSTQHVLHFIQ